MSARMKPCLPECDTYCHNDRINADIRSFEAMRECLRDGQPFWHAAKMSVIEHLLGHLMPDCGCGE